MDVRRGRRRAAARQPRHALRLRQPRLPALAADAGCDARARLCARRCGAAAAAARALQWGMPILESSITFIDGKRLYYRGHDVAMLARSRSVEEVASLVWTGRFDAPLSTALPARTRPARTGTGRLVKSGGLPFVG